MFTVARSLMKRESLQLNDNVSIHLMNLEYVTLVLTDLDWLQSLKQFFINVSYHILVASLTLMALFYA